MASFDFFNTIGRKADIDLAQFQEEKLSFEYRERNRDACPTNWSTIEKAGELGVEAPILARIHLAGR